MKDFDRKYVCLLLTFCVIALVFGCLPKSEEVNVTSDLRQINMWINLYEDQNGSTPSNLETFIKSRSPDAASIHIMKSMADGKITYLSSAGENQPRIIWQTGKATIILYGSGHIESKRIK